jgi:hypothetical protein
MRSIHPAALEKRLHRDANAFASLVGGDADLFADADSLTNSPAFSAFEAAYDLSGYSSVSGDYHDADSSDLSGPQALINCGQDWDERFHDPQLF